MMRESSSGNSYSTYSKVLERSVMMLVIDPSQLGAGGDNATSVLNAFKAANSDLISKIQNGNAVANNEIRIPGIRAGKLKIAALNSDTMIIPKELFDELNTLS